MSGSQATQIHNERIKLLATALNNLGLAIIVAGFVAPAVSGQLQGGAQIAATITARVSATPA